MLWGSRVSEGSKSSDAGFEKGAHLRDGAEKDGVRVIQVEPCPVRAVRAAILADRPIRGRGHRWRCIRGRWRC